ncbi:hypothetical protein LguiB_024650 [Lonicera macranthoides]
MKMKKEAETLLITDALCLKKIDTILKNKIKISSNYLKKKEGGVFLLLFFYFHSTFINDIIYNLKLYC